MKSGTDLTSNANMQSNVCKRNNGLDKGSDCLVRNVQNQRNE